MRAYGDEEVARLCGRETVLALITVLSLGIGDASQSWRDDAALDVDLCCGCGLPQGVDCCAGHLRSV